MGKALYCNVATISFAPLAASWHDSTCVTYKNKLSQESNALGINNSAAGVTNCNFNPIKKNT